MFGQTVQIEIDHRKYPPYGRCIYCGSTEGKLTEEHIIPYGMYGRLSIPDASCGKCQIETHKFETDCQTKMLGFYRYSIGFPSRKKKQRPKEFAVQIDKGLTPQAPNVQKLPMNLAPQVLAMPVYGAPMFYDNARIYPDTYWQFWASPDDLSKIHKTTGKRTSFNLTINRKSFLRMLCKIAHTYLFGAVNNPEVLRDFKPLLTDFIMSPDGEPQQYVGSRIEKFPVTKSLHTLNVVRFPYQNKEYLLVKIRLFAYLNPQPPTYYAVAAVKENTA